MTVYQYLQEFEGKNSAVISSVSQRSKQGLTCLPSDYFTSAVTVIKWNRQEQKSGQLLDSREFQLYQLTWIKRANK